MLSPSHPIICDFHMVFWTAKTRKKLKFGLRLEVLSPGPHSCSHTLGVNNKNNTHAKLFMSRRGKSFGNYPTHEPRARRIRARSLAFWAFSGVLCKLKISKIGLNRSIEKDSEAYAASPLTANCHNWDCTWKNIFFWR